MTGDLTIARRLYEKTLRDSEARGIEKAARMLSDRINHIVMPDAWLRYFVRELMAEAVKVRKGK